MSEKDNNKNDRSTKKPSQGSSSRPKGKGQPQQRGGNGNAARNKSGSGSGQSKNTKRPAAAQSGQGKGKASGSNVSRSVPSKQTRSGNTGSYRPAAQTKKNGGKPVRQSQSGAGPSKQQQKARPEAKSTSKPRRDNVWNTVVYLCVLMAVVVVSLVLVLTVFFKTETITVEREGEVVYDDSEIISCCGIEEGDNLLLADVKGAGERISTSLPYIEICEVKRALPSTVRINVTAARVAGAITTTDGRQIAVSTTGKALELINSPEEAGIIPINGITAFYSAVGEKVECDDYSRFAVAGQIVETYSRMGLAVTSISFTADGEVSFVYDGRITVKLGQPEGLETKLALSASAFTDGSIADYERGLMDVTIGDSAYFATEDIVEQYGLK